MKFPIIHLILVLLVFGCTQKETSKQIKDLEKNRIQDSLTVKKSKPILLDSAVSLHLIRNLSESYNPPRFGRLPELNDSTKAAFEVLKQKNYPEFQKYLSLIFIKLNRSHLRTSHQTFELRNRDGEGDSLKKEREFLVYEFNSMAELYPFGKRVEMFTSNEAQIWIEKNPELLKDKEIKKEMKAIQSVTDSIARGLY